MLQGCSTDVPGFAAGQREQTKIDADRASSQPVSRLLHGGWCPHTTCPCTSTGTIVQGAMSINKA